MLSDPAPVDTEEQEGGRSRRHTTSLHTDINGRGKLRGAFRTEAAFHQDCGILEGTGMVRHAFRRKERCRLGHSSSRGLKLTRLHAQDWKTSGSLQAAYLDWQVGSSAGPQAWYSL